MMIVNILKKEMPITWISRAMNIPGSTIHYNRIERSGDRKPRVMESIESEINKLSGERTTYGYRRIWALMRN